MAKKVKFELPEGITTKELVAAARELNKPTVLGLDPKIPTTKISDEELVEKLLEACELFEDDTDIVSEAVHETLAAIGGKGFEAADDEEDEDEDEEEESDDEESDEEESDEEDEDEEEEEEEEDDDDEDDEDDEEEEEEEEEKPAKGKKAAAPAKKEVPAKKAAKTPKEKKEGIKSFQTIADELLAEEASDKAILKAFTAAYLERKGIDDIDFVQKRANIYMDIARTKAGLPMKKQSKKEAEKAAPAKGKKAEKVAEKEPVKEEKKGGKKVAIDTKKKK